MNSVKISVIIPTCNRIYKLIRCIEAIESNNFQNGYEIIIVDQGGVRNKDILKFLKYRTKIKYIYAKRKCLSAAYNKGIVHAKAKIIAFTSDDCIVSTSWLNQIEQSFIHNDVAAVSGMTLPFLQSKKNKNQVCFSIIKNSKPQIISQPCFHAKYIGFSNNFAIKKDVINSIGLFKEWLGPGTIGLHGNDAEIIFRILILGHSISYNPKMLCWHDHWVYPKQALIQGRIYNTGEIAAYGYYMFKGQISARKIVINNFKRFNRKVISNIAFNIRHGHPKRLMFFIYFFIIELFYRFYGLSIAFYHSKIHE